jgi:hypothetical protein
LLLAAAAAVAVAALFLLTGKEADEPVGAIRLDRCRGVLADAARDCLVRELQVVVGRRDDPRPAVAAIERAVRREGGFVLASCHGVMHTVGRRYAEERGLELEGLPDVLPRSNDPGCSAGFAHGVVTAVGPDRPEDAAATCAKTGTRYRRYSCVHGLGHAFMRSNSERLEPALALCRDLGSRDAADCAQGAYHDYWFAALGLDEAALPATASRDPRAVCGAQAVEFVRPCWYRAFVDNRPPGIEVDSPEYLDVLCKGLAGLQRQACVTGVALIGPADPAEQLAICAGLVSASDQAACVRGTKVQNLVGASIDDYVRLARGCSALDAAEACQRWLGTALQVVTDGRFGRQGCPGLATPAARRSCVAGARSSEGALETFS